MKKLFSLLVLSGLLFSYPVKSQIAYYDAITLKNWATLDSNQFNDSIVHAIAGIMYNYSLTTDKTFDNVYDAINKIKGDNLFLSKYFKIKEPDRKTFVAYSVDKKIVTYGIGSTDVTNIANGLAQFLIKRGKQELDVAFFDHMKTFLQNHVECTTLFPATTDFLSKIASYQYSELLQGLREAFQKDLNNLIINLNRLIDLPKYQILLKSLPEIRIAVRSSKIVSELSNGNGNSIHPDSLIHLLATIQDWSDLNQNLANGWKLLDLLSQSLKSTDIVKYGSWISFQDFNKLFDDPVARDMFLGIIYEKAKGIQFKIDKESISVATFMKENANNISIVTDFFENFMTLANQVDKSLSVYKTVGETSSNLNDQYYDYINSVIQVLEYGFKVADLIKPGIANDSYIIIANNANSLYQNISSTNYSAAIMNVYAIINEVITLSKKESDKLKDQADNSKINIEDAKNLKKVATQIIDSTASTSNTVQFILKYGNLMAGIIKAKTPEDAESAIEAAVLPAGSSSIKKNTAWNISINAYVGYLTGPPVSNSSNSWYNNKGVTAPIGIAFSRSLGDHLNLGIFNINHFNLGSISAFVTLLNVGSIVQYQLNDSGTAVNQQINLANIISPGGYLVYGFFAHLPLAISYGWQYGPRIFTVAADSGTRTTDKPGWRANWTFTIDIPLANLYTVGFKHNVSKY